MGRKLGYRTRAAAAAFGPLTSFQRAAHCAPHRRGIRRPGRHPPLADAAWFRRPCQAPGEGNTSRPAPPEDDAVLVSPGDEPGTRQAFCEGHVVVYEVDPDTLDNATAGDVLVLRVFAPGQDRR